MKILRLAFIVLGLVISYSSKSQTVTNVPLASEAEIKRYFELTGKMEAIKQTVGAIVAQLKKSSPGVSQEFWNQFQNETNVNELIETTIPIYKNYFTEDDIKQLVAFNESPVGQKLISITPELTKDLMQAGSKWGENLQQKVDAALQKTNLSPAISNGQMKNGSPDMEPNKAHSHLRDLTPQEAAKLRAQGINPDDYQFDTDIVVPAEQHSPQATMTPTPSDLKNASIWMDNFMGIKNANIVADVISLKPEALKFRLHDQDYDYSGHYTVMLNTPRQHKTPYFGFGSPETAKVLIFNVFQEGSLPLQNVIIWEKSSGFIDVTALGKEWIYSGTYTIQN